MKQLVVSGYFSQSPMVYDDLSAAVILEEKTHKSSECCFRLKTAAISNRILKDSYFYPFMMIFFHFMNFFTRIFYNQYEMRCGKNRSVLLHCEYRAGILTMVSGPRNVHR